ncbi:MAG TPA: GGDEF domain-containing protein [Solirubrobacterales bacterium]|nr:GGDEF domain-containing protein [Solirubrobacterales bacterium]
MIEIGHTAHQGSPGRNRLAPSDVYSRRLVERAGGIDRATQAVGALVGSILLATAIFRSAWALLPLAALLAALALGPLAIRRVDHPEYAELASGLPLTIAMAVAAGLTGGTSSPIVFLLPIGVVMNALRAGPISIAVCSLVTVVVFLATSLLENGAAVVAEPLPMLAVLAMQAGVTIGSIHLARAEIGHRRASTVDPLTGLLNRHGLADRFEELRRRALVSAAPITLVLFDLDHFKRVNDVSGHDVGDRILREVADEIRTRLRQFELVYRIGGEEFLVLLPGAAEWEGENIAEQLRLGVEDVGKRTAVGVTASFGVSCASGAEIEFAELFRRADRALYQAKRDGRDRVAAGGERLLS